MGGLLSAPARACFHEHLTFAREPRSDGFGLSLAMLIQRCIDDAPEQNVIHPRARRVANEQKSGHDCVYALDCLRGRP